MKHSIGQYLAVPSYSSEVHCFPPIVGTILHPRVDKQGPPSLFFWYGQDSKNWHDVDWTKMTRPKDR